MEAGERVLFQCNAGLDLLLNKERKGQEKEGEMGYEEAELLYDLNSP